MKKAGFLTILAIILLIFSSCDDFFSTSWGTWRTWDPDQIKINPNNLQALVLRAAGDPRFADALTQAIIRELEGNPPPVPPYSDDLRAAGIKCAIKSSEIGVAVLFDNMDTLLKIIENDEYDEDSSNLFLQMLRELQKNFGKGEQAAAYIIVILAPEINEPPPEFKRKEYIDSSDAIQAVLLLTLAMLDGQEVTDDTDDLSDMLGFTQVDGKIHLTSQATSKEPRPGMAKTLAAYINYFADPDNDSSFSGFIRQAFGLE